MNRLAKWIHEKSKEKQAVGNYGPVGRALAGQSPQTGVDQGSPGRQGDCMYANEMARRAVVVVKPDTEKGCNCS
jgi:hypothetical protein